MRFLSRLFGGGNAAGRAAADARAAEDARQARTTEAIGRVNETFGRFNDPFFAQREQAYMDFAMPQLGDQYADARRSLAFALSRGGLTRSSVAASRLADLEKGYGTRKQEIADAARGYGQQARADVEQARGNLISQAQGTADAALAGNLAMNEANRLASGPSFSPLGALFANVGAGIGVGRAARETDEVRRALGVRVQQPNSAMRIVGAT